MKGLSHLINTTLQLVNTALQSVNTILHSTKSSLLTLSPFGSGRRLLQVLMVFGTVLLSINGYFLIANSDKKEWSFKQSLILGLAEKTKEENTRLPMMLDASTRLDRVGSHGLEYIYFLSVVGKAGDQFQEDIEAGRLDRRHQSAKWSICESAEMANLLQAGIRLTYQYSANGIDNVTAVTVDKSDCV